MIPVSFPEQNFIFTKPEGWTDEQCMDLPVWKGQTIMDESGVSVPVIISKWRFSKEDLEEIARTGCIYLSITGMGQPPVSLFTEYPFIEQKKGD